jgi:NADPH-dependent ferric siderophore reductase
MRHRGFVLPDGSRDDRFADATVPVAEFCDEGPAAPGGAHRMMHGQALLQPWARRWRGIRRLRVLRTALVTPLMRRITLGGPEIAGLSGGPNVKLLLPPRPGMELDLPLQDAAGNPLWLGENRRPVLRSYTVRRLDEAAGELDIDFVLHGAAGVASAWAASAGIGDEAGVAGLGGRTVCPAARYILAGDHSALPALLTILAGLPDTARGDAFIEVPDEAEQQPLRHPPGLRVTWLHHGPHGAGRSGLLERAVAALPVAQGRAQGGAQGGAQGADVFAWVGAESAAATAIGTHLREVHGLDRRAMLVLGYWNLGLSVDDYARRQAGEARAAA